MKVLIVTIGVLAGLSAIATAGLVIILTMDLKNKKEGKESKYWEEK